MYIKNLIFKRKFFTLVVIVMTFIFLTVFSLIIGIYQSVYDYSKINATGYSIVDRYDSDELKEFLANNTSLEKLKKMYELYREKWSYSWCIMTEQPIYIENDAKSYEFVDGYGVIHNEKLNLKRINCIQMNAPAINISKLDLLYGRAFEESEYVYNDSAVPVILGYNYKDFLKINDRFLINYLGKEMEVKVVGILSEGACAAKDSYSVLDNYVVMPALEFLKKPVSEEECSFQLKVYLGHTNSFVYSENNVLKLQRDLDDICKAVEIEPYIFMGVLPIDLFGMGFARSIYLSVALAIAFCVLCMLGMAYVFSRKQKSVIGDFKIDSRTQFIKLCFSIILEDWILIIISSIPCVILCLLVLFTFNVEVIDVVIIECFLCLLAPTVSLYSVYKIYSREYKSE